MSDMYGKIDRDLMSYLESECGQLTKKAKEICHKHAKKCAEKIASDSPKDTGEYAKGWTAKKAYENPSSIESIVYNKTKPTLTWLLEKGHCDANGHRVSDSKPHIVRNLEEQSEEFYEELKNI